MKKSFNLSQSINTNFLSAIHVDRNLTTPSTETTLETTPTTVKTTQATVETTRETQENIDIIQKPNNEENSTHIL